MTWHKYTPLAEDGESCGVCKKDKMHPIHGPRGRQFGPRLVPKKQHNITIDGDAFKKLSELRNELERQLGFLPTLSQTVMHVIAHFQKGRT